MAQAAGRLGFVIRGWPIITCLKLSRKILVSQMGLKYRKRLQGWPLAGVKTVWRVFGTSARLTYYVAKN